MVQVGGVNGTSGWGHWKETKWSSPSPTTYCMSGWGQSRFLLYCMSGCGQSRFLLYSKYAENPDWFVLYECPSEDLPNGLINASAIQVRGVAGEGVAGEGCDR